MKAFLAGMVAMVAIAVVAFVAIGSQQIDTAQNHASQNVRLPGAN